MDRPAKLQEALLETSVALQEHWMKIVSAAEEGGLEVKDEADRVPTVSSGYKWSSHDPTKQIVRSCSTILAEANTNCTCETCIDAHLRV